MRTRRRPRLQGRRGRRMVVCLDSVPTAATSAVVERSAQNANVHRVSAVAKAKAPPASTPKGFRCDSRAKALGSIPDKFQKKRAN
jgi:hypothetical protein